MTSNIGSQHLLEGVDDSGVLSDAAEDAVMREMRAHFRPEFLNRVDDIVVFKPLTLAEIQKIVGLLTEELRARLAERNVALHMSGAAVEMAAREGFDPVYGARPLKRFLQRELETRIGRAIVAGDVVEGSTIEVVVENGALTVAIEAPVLDGEVVEE